MRKTAQKMGERGPAARWGITMYRLVYWTGVTLFVAWIAFSAYSALSGL